MFFQAASVTPVSRDGTPMALLRPMKATETSSSSSASGDSSSSAPVVWQQQQQVPAPARAVSESSEEAPAGGTNVQLVRPQDLHIVQVPAPVAAAAPAPAAQPPTTSTQPPPLLKRTRPVEVVQQTEEPQVNFHFTVVIFTNC